MTTPSPIEITIKVNASDLMPFLIALLTLRDESGRTPAPPFSSPFSRGFRGFRVSGPFGGPADMVSDIDGLLREVSNLEDLQALLQILTREGSDESERMRAYRDARGPKTTGATGAGDDTPPDEPQGSEGEPEGDDTPPEGQGEGTAETPEDTRLRFYFQHEGED